MADEIKLGSTVKDKVTGLIGTANQLRETLFGTRQIGIQPMGDGKTIPDPYFVDVQTIEVIDAGLSESACQNPDHPEVNLGDKVRDVTSGEKGIATSRLTFMNGCVYFAVTVKAKGKRDAQKYVSNHKALEVILPGALSNAPTSSSGGPSTKAFRQEDC
ncbi:MAG: hypothetical protein HGA71_08375 [Azonexaceae bacterium]|nr:hypothetical protein [Azonexaceae bacterium]